MMMLFLLQASVSVLWNTYGECENFAVLKGHTGAIMQIAFSTDGTSVISRIISCSHLLLFYPLELSQMFVNMSESSAVGPRRRPNWDMLIFSA